MYKNNSRLIKNYEMSCEDGLKHGVDNLLNPHINVQNTEWSPEGIPRSFGPNKEDCRKVISYTSKNNSKNNTDRKKITRLTKIKDKMVLLKNKTKKYFCCIILLIIICCIIVYLMHTSYSSTPSTTLIKSNINPSNLPSMKSNSGAYLKYRN